PTVLIPGARTQARDCGVGCFARHCDWRRSIALTIKLAQNPGGGRTKPGGNHMAKFVQANFVVTQSAAPQSAAPQSAARCRAPRRKILQGTLAALMAIPLAGLQMRHVA